MTQKAIDIVKSRGRRSSEPFDPVKLHTSVHAACLSVRSPVGQATTTARSVTQAVIIWCDNKSTVTSQDIRLIAAKHLRVYHPEAAYIYEHYPTII